jgi:hypothetical protein
VRNPFDPNTYYWDWWESGAHERPPVMPLRDLVKQTPLAAGQEGDYVGWVVLGVDEQMEDEDSRQRVGTFFYGNKATGEVRQGGYWMDWPEDESQRSWKRYIALPVRERAEMEVREQLKWGLKRSFDLAGRERNPYDAHAAGWRWQVKFVVYGPTGRVLGTVYGRDVADARDNLRPHIKRLGLAAAQLAHLRPWASSKPEERAAASARYGGVEIGKPDKEREA